MRRRGCAGSTSTTRAAVLVRAYPFAELRRDALAWPHRLIARRRRSPSDRIALVAETGPDFAALFFGAIYAGAWPVPLPLPTSFGGARFLYRPARRSSSTAPTPSCCFYPAELAADGAEPPREAAGVAGPRAGRASRRREAPEAPLPQAARRRDRLSPIFERLDPLPARRRDHPSRPARQSRRAQSRHEASAHGDRCVSWLPWYHDMGLVGCLLSPVANQVSTDYLKTEDFARRPLAWLDLISRNQGTTLSYSPTFGYDICARRIVAARPRSPSASTCRAGGSRATAPT